MFDIHAYIGSGPETILWWQMAFRATLIFFFALVLIRFGDKRIFGKNTSFDIVLSVILGSILSRALTANAQFFPTLAAAATLVFLHMLLANIALHSKRAGHLFKGREDQLVKNGIILWDAMKKNNITEHDLKEAIRSNASAESIDAVKNAYLERSGQISIIRK